MNQRHEAKMTWATFLPAEGADLIKNRTSHLLKKPDILTCYEQNELISLTLGPLYLNITSTNGFGARDL